MTDDTKKLFKATWVAEEYKHGHGAWVVRRSDGCLIAENMAGQDANRLSHLPELYDTLLHCICSSCNACIYDHCGSPVECEQLLSQDCTYELSKLCFEHKARELLRKVKDGV